MPRWCPWRNLENYLASSAGADVLDELVLGARTDVDELLADYGIPATSSSRIRFAALADRLILEGIA